MGFREVLVSLNGLKEAGIIQDYASPIFTKLYKSTLP